MPADAREPNDQPEVLAYGRSEPPARQARRIRLLWIVGAVLVPMGMVISGMFLNLYLMSRNPSGGIYGGYYIYAGMAIGSISLLALPIHPTARVMLTLAYLPVSYVGLFFCLMLTCAILGGAW